MQGKKNILITAPAAYENRVLPTSIELDFVSFITTQNTLFEKENLILNLAQKPIKAIFTSNKAAVILTNFLSHKNIIPAWQFFCIRYATQKTIANYFGQKNILETAETAKELSAIIAQACPPKEKLYFFCGNKKRSELEESVAQLEIKNIEIYQTILTPKKINKQYSAILFFSPSAIESFFMLNTVSPKTTLFVIGPTSLKYLKSYSLQNQIIQNTQMGKTNLIQQAVQYLDTK